MTHGYSFNVSLIPVAVPCIEISQDGEVIFILKELFEVGRFNRKYFGKVFDGIVVKEKLICSEGSVRDKVKDKNKVGAPAQRAKLVTVHGLVSSECWRKL